MIKKYGRKKANFFGWIVFGLMLVWKIYTENTIVIVYDGLFLIGALLSFIYGFWGLITPLVKINKYTIKLKPFPFTTKKINLEQIHESDCLHPIRSTGSTAPDRDRKTCTPRQ